MQKNILWKGIEYDSRENCIVTLNDSGINVNSVIIGSYNKVLYRVDYKIKTNKYWETTLVKIKTQLLDKAETIEFRSDGKGNWVKDGKIVKHYAGCIDVDILLTPFTNTLPIKRLGLEKTETKNIKVLYFDVLAQQIRVVDQKYTRLSELKYKYENVPNDFEAIITIDEFGLVKKYPQLFTRTMIVDSSYS